MRLLVKNIARIVGIRPAGVERVCGAGMAELPELTDAWLLAEEGRIAAYLVTRTVTVEEAGGAKVLRIVDFIGRPEQLPRLGAAIDRIMQAEKAEYADCYCAGISPALFLQAGFVERKEEDAVVIPNYLDPPLYENTEYYYFTNQPDGFVLFKADGDQDRPNLG